MGLLALVWPSVGHCGLYHLEIMDSEKGGPLQGSIQTSDLSVDILLGKRVLRYYAAEVISRL